MDSSFVRELKFSHPRICFDVLLEVLKVVVILLQLKASPFRAGRRSAGLA